MTTTRHTITKDKVKSVVKTSNKLTMKPSQSKVLNKVSSKDTNTTKVSLSTVTPPVSPKKRVVVDYSQRESNERRVFTSKVSVN